MPRRRTLLTAAAVAGTLVATAVPATAGPQAAYPRPGTNALVSIAEDGTPADGPSYDASPSADGSVVAFFTQASTLTNPPGNPYGNVAVRDLRLGTTELVSVAHDGGNPNQMSMQAGVSGDGRYVAFLSYATNLVEGDDADGKAAQVYVRDLQTDRTERITSRAGGGASRQGSLGPELSYDGRYVVWHGFGTDQVPGDTNNAADIFLHDRHTGITKRISVAADGTQADSGSFYPMISADGSTVVFQSRATNLVPNDTNGVRDVFAVTVATGAVERVSVGDGGVEGNYDATYSDVSADGSVVAFQSGASNLVPTDTNGSGGAIYGFDVFVRDRKAGRTERASLDSWGEELGESMSPSVSADGRFVAFQSIKPGEDPSSFTSKSDTFVHDRLTKATETLSVTPSGKPASGESDNPRLTDDGRSAVYQTSAPDLIPGDGNEQVDIFLRRRGPDTGIVSLAKVTRFGETTVRGTYTVGAWPLARATEPADSTAPSGADLVESSVTYRPEEGDLLVRLILADLPRVSPSSGPQRILTAGLSDVATGGVIYGLRFTLDVPYELRASRVGALADTAYPAGVTQPITGFDLYRCSANCAKVAEVDGGFGTAGDEIRMSLPMAPLGLEAGESLTDVRAVTGAGDAALGLAGAAADEIALGKVTLPAISVRLGTSAADARAEDVSFDHASGFLAGSFSTPLPADAGPGRSIWARACIADRCGVARLDP